MQIVIPFEECFKNVGILFGTSAVDDDNDDYDDDIMSTCINEYINK